MIFAGLLNSCLKDEYEDDRNAAEAEFRAYLSSNGYTESDNYDGVYIKFLEIPDPNARKPEAYDPVIVDYIGKYADGTIYETSDPDLADQEDIRRNDAVYGPHKIYVGYTIAGISIALINMPVGSRAEVVVPQELGFNDYKTRVYELEVHEIIDDEKAFELELIDSCLVKNGFSKKDSLFSGFYPKDIRLVPEADTAEVGDTITVKIIARFAEYKDRYSWEEKGRQFYPPVDTSDNPSVIEDYVFGDENYLFNYAVNTAISNMREGEIREFVCESDYAYPDGWLNETTGVYYVPLYTGIHYYIELRKIGPQ